MKDIDELKYLEMADEQAEELEKHNMVGIITLENVIEKIMQIDINDEKDRDLAANLQRRGTIKYGTPYPSDADA